MKVWFDTIRRHAHKIFLGSQPTGQGAHSDPKFAGRSDIYLSTLRSYVEALGGHLEIAAVFGDERLPVKVGPTE